MQKSVNELTNIEYDLFRNFLSKSSGIVLGDNKQYLVSSRLNKILEAHGLFSYSEMIEKLKEGRDQRFKEAIVDAMTTNETNWFRDNHPYTNLTEKILPEFKQQKIGAQQPLKIWSAACSSGQEPYTISICISEYLNGNPGVFSAGVQIIGTDISNTILEQAKLGVYDPSAINRGLSPERQKTYFESVMDPNNKMSLLGIRKREKDRVSFRYLNLLDSFVLLGKFNIIFCRNVLIYFSNDTKREIIKKFANSLLPGGYLMLGASESMDPEITAFDMIKSNAGLIYKKK
ncbi:MAG: CheR family methyltransferase [Gammaproteobacteria bacterium]